MKAKLYQYAAVFNPTEKERKDGDKPKLIVKPNYVLAETDQEAQMRAILDIPDNYKEKLSQVELAVRPF